MFRFEVLVGSRCCCGNVRPFHFLLNFICIMPVGGSRHNWFINVNIVMHSIALLDVSDYIDSSPLCLVPVAKTVEKAVM